MKRIFTLIAATAAIFSTSVAQGDFDDVRFDFTLRAGVFFPFDDNMSDLSDIWFAAGFDVEVDRGLIPGASTVISVDSMTHNWWSEHVTFPININQRWYSGDWPRRTYFQVGIGVAANDFQPADTVFGARAGVGMEWNETILFEADVFWSEEDTTDTSVLGVAGYVGWRF